MPRKTRYELEALNAAPEPGSESYWKVKKMEAQARQAMLMAQHRKMLIDKMSDELIPKTEVVEMFHRVFAAYKRATKEVERRYGHDAAAILLNAEKSALRSQQEDKKLCQKAETASSGKALSPKAAASGQSKNSQSKK